MSGEIKMKKNIKNRMVNSLNDAIMQEVKAHKENIEKLICAQGSLFETPDNAEWTPEKSVQLEDMRCYIICRLSHDGRKTPSSVARWSVGRGWEHVHGVNNMRLSLSDQIYVLA